MHETKLRYSEPLLQKAVLWFFVRAITRQLGVPFFIVMGFVIFLTAWFLYRHETSWIVGFSVAALLFVCALIVAIYVAHYRNTIGRFRKMTTPEATFSCND